MLSDIQKAQAAKILSCYGINPEDEIEKAKGEGSRGGTVVGHSKSGKAIYEKMSDHEKVYHHQTVAAGLRHQGDKEGAEHHMEHFKAHANKPVIGGMKTVMSDTKASVKAYHKFSKKHFSEDGDAETRKNEEIDYANKHKDIHKD